MSPACFIFMPVAAIVKVLPAPTAWASSVLPPLMPRQTASSWCGLQRDGLVHAGEVEVRAVEQPGPQVVVGVVVEPHQPLGAVGVGEDPRPEPLLDELLLLAGGERRLLVDDPLLAVAVVHGVVDDRRLHVEGQLEQPGAVGPRRAVVGGGGDRLLGGVVGLDAPDGVFLQVADRDRRTAATPKSSAANAWMSLAGIHGAPRLASMSPGSTSSGCTARRASALRA